MDTPATTSPEGLLAETQERKAWGTLAYHFRNGHISHTILHETFRPSAAPHLAATINAFQRLNPTTIPPQEDYELVFARFRGTRLILIATERHSLCTPTTGDTSKKEETTHER